MIPVPEHIASLQPYVPGKPLDELFREKGITEAVKLASNENPLGPSPMAVEAIGLRPGRGSQANRKARGQCDGEKQASDRCHVLLLLFDVL